MSRDEDDIDATRVSVRVSAAGGALGAAPLYDGRACLKVLSGPLLGRRLFLDFGESTLGRAEEATITIPDPNVSREHAAIFFDGRAFRLVDRESRNGTLCNGRPVVEHALSFGDRVCVGANEMIFTCEGFELAASRPDQAILAYRRAIERNADFVAALTGLRDLLATQTGRREDVETIERVLARLKR